MQVQFPKTQVSDGQAPTLGLNGFYSKEAMSLKGGF